MKIHGTRYPRRARTGLLLAVCAVAILFALSRLVLADQPLPRCADRETFERELRARWSEVKVAEALATEGELIEVYASPGGATFTVVVVQPTGEACVVAEGTDWMRGAMPAPGEDT